MEDEKDLSIHAQMAALADCVSLAISDCPNPCQALTMPGTTPYWMGVDSAYVRLVNVYPTTTYPEQTDDPDASCGQYLAATLEVGVLRCMPSPRKNQTQDGTLLDKAAKRQAEDMELLYDAIRCCTGLNDTFIRQYTPRAIQGLTYGGSWTVIISNLPGD